CRMSYSGRISSLARLFARLISSPLTRCRLARTDDPNYFVLFGMPDNHDSPLVRHAGCEKALFVLRMIGIPNRGRQRIAKHCARLLEGNAVLGKIGCRLPRVPFELHQIEFSTTAVPRRNASFRSNPGYTHKRPLEPEDDCLYTVEVRFEWD